MTTIMGNGVSDSDSDYEVDFLAKAIAQTQGSVLKEFAGHNSIDDDVLSSDSTSDARQASTNHSPRRKRTKASIATKSRTPSPSLSDSESPNVSLKITPPRSPLSRPRAEVPYATRSRRTVTGPQKLVRGGRRSRKTERALAKLKKERSERRNALNEDNPSISDSEITIMTAQSFELKVRWRHEIIRDIVHPSENIAEILKRLALKIQIPSHELHLQLGRDILKPSETIASRQVGVATILTLTRTQSVPEIEADSDLIEIHCQTGDRRSTVVIKLAPNDSMSHLMEQFARMKNCPMSECRFTFDGEEINGDDTPKLLELEDGEVIDVVMVKK